MSQMDPGSSQHEQTVEGMGQAAHAPHAFIYLGHRCEFSRVWQQDADDGEHHCPASGSIAKGGGIERDREIRCVEYRNLSSIVQRT